VPVPALWPSKMVLLLPLVPVLLLLIERKISRA
jgi:hypothetical protein